MVVLAECTNMYSLVYVRIGDSVELYSLVLKLVFRLIEAVLQESHMYLADLILANLLASSPDHSQLFSVAC